MPKSFRYTIIALFLLPILIMACKTVQMGGDLSPLLPEKHYRVTYQFMFDSPKDEIFVKAFIPQSNEHQNIQVLETYGSEFPLRIKKGVNGHLARWEFTSSGIDSTASLSQVNNDIPKITYTFSFIGREIRYTLANKLPFPTDFPDSIKPYLEPSEHIQSDDSEIQEKALEISGGMQNMTSVLRRIYSYTYKIPRIQSSELMDAKTCMVERQSSCNGRSRLFVAMARSLHIPARLVGGIILDEGSKRTSHQWVEAFVQGNWIPFDALNGHYASLPAHYMELYKGDEFLMSHTPDIHFDWMFHIEEEILSSQRARAQNPAQSNPFKDPILVRMSQVGMSIGFIKILLLLPVLGLVVILCKNVVGLKTIGTFLPAILGVSLHFTGPLYGLLILGMVIMWVRLIYQPLESWGLLQSPKLVVLLTGVVLIILLSSSLGINRNSGAGSPTTFFPIIILTFLSERFARKIDEEGMVDASKLLGQTLIVALACYVVFSASFLEALLMLFPELLLIVMGITLLVGKWIGLRLMEYVRFRSMILDGEG